MFCAFAGSVEGSEEGATDRGACRASHTLLQRVCRVGNRCCRRKAIKIRLRCFQARSLALHSLDRLKPMVLTQWVKKKGGLSNATSILVAPWCAHTSGSKGDLWEPGAAGQRQI